HPHGLRLAVAARQLDHGHAGVFGFRGNSHSSSREGLRTKDEGLRTKDEGRRTKDEGRRTKDEGRRTKDEGRSQRRSALSLVLCPSSFLKCRCRPGARSRADRILS